MIYLALISQLLFNPVEATAGVTGVHSSTHPDTVTIADVVRLALENDKRLKMNRLELEKTRLDLREIKGKNLPGIVAYSNFVHNYAIPKMVIPGEIFGQQGNMPVELGTAYDWSSGVKIGQVIFNRSLSTGIQIYQELLNTGSLALELREKEIIYNVSQLFYLIFTLQEQISVLDETLSNLGKINQVVSLMAKNSVVTYAEVDRSEISLNFALNAKLTLLEQKRQQIELLKILTGTPRENNIVIGPEKAFREYHSKAINRVDNPRVDNPRVEKEILDKEVVIKELELKAIKEQSLPTVNAFAQHYYQAQRDNLDFFKSGDQKFYGAGLIGIGIEIPIFSGLQLKTRRERARVELNRAVLQRDYSNEMMDKELRDIIGSIELQERIIETTHENLQRAQSVYDKYLKGFSEQVVTLTDLLTVQNSVCEIKLKLYEEVLKQQILRLSLQKITR